MKEADLTEKLGTRLVVFADAIRVAVGDPAVAAVAARRASDRAPNASVLVFDADTGAVVDLDLRGTEDEISSRHAQTPDASPAKRGRPKLGVVSKEVTLLPQHWEWLARQRGGASVTLRALVDAARRAEPAAEPVKVRQEAAYRFMTAMAGDLPGFEETLRALFAGDRNGLEHQSSAWPGDIQDEMLKFAYGRDNG